MKDIIEIVGICVLCVASVLFYIEFRKHNAALAAKIEDDASKAEADAKADASKLASKL
jgi:hypothetical protein